jgi:trans-aconitate methyltransferase
MFVKCFCLVLLMFSNFLMAADETADFSGWNGRLYTENRRVQSVWAENFLNEIPLKGDEEILDFGCGTGENTRLLLKRLTRGKITGFDKAQSQIDVAKSNSRSEREPVFLVQDITKYHPDFQNIDIIVSTVTLHWVEDQDSVIKHAHSYLRKGGKIYFLIPTRWDLFTQLVETFQVMKKHINYVKYLANTKPQCFVHKPDQYTDRLVKNGFRLENLRVRPKENAFSKDEFIKWLRAWVFAEFYTIPEEAREQFLIDFVDTYVGQPEVFKDDQIHYYGYLMEIEATKL